MHDCSSALHQYIDNSNLCAFSTPQIESQPTPLNLQLPEWEGQVFSTSINGNTLTVTRVDIPGAPWDQPLRLEALTTDSAACIRGLSIVPSSADGGPAHLLLSSAVTIQPSCVLRLHADEGHTHESLHVTDLQLDVKDCYSRCGPFGSCVDDSGSEYDGVSRCDCIEG